jgi:hypothetical protein
MPINRLRYPENWEEIAKNVIHKADGRCHFCGKVTGFYALVKNSWILVPDGMVDHYRKDEIRVFKMVLSAIHLNHDPSDNRSDNLRCACNWCHLEHDKGFHIDSRKYGRDHRLNQLGLFE